MNRYYVTDATGYPLVTLTVRNGLIRPMGFSAPKDARFAAKCYGLAEYTITDKRPDDREAEPKVAKKCVQCGGSGFIRAYPSSFNHCVYGDLPTSRECRACLGRG